MIQASFCSSGKSFTGVKISGHADFAEFGQDIVCASVTSAVQLTANAITEILGAPATVEAGENTIVIQLTGQHPQAEQFLAALHLHLDILAQEYTDYIRLTDLEG